MVFKAKEILLKNGENAILRSPTTDDAEELLKCFKTTAAETDYILSYPEECDYTIEFERSFIENVNSSANAVMIVCTVNGEMAGSCHLSFMGRIKNKHRASVAIGLISKFWNLGIGSAMFREMIRIAKERGTYQLELEYIEGNARAKALYEKVGFAEVAEHPNAIRLRDGRMLSDFLMILPLDRA